jgi:hypothetical protein
MSASKQFGIILEKCSQIAKEQQKQKTEIHKIQAIAGAATAELNALKERIDLFVNQDFFLNELQKRETKKKNQS